MSCFCRVVQGASEDDFEIVISIATSPSKSAPAAQRFQ
jgi:hypothetical protein